MVSRDFVLDFRFTGTLAYCQAISVYNKTHDNSEEENGQAAIAAKAGAWLCPGRAVSPRRGTVDCGRGSRVWPCSIRLDSRRPVERSPSGLGALATRRKEDFLFWPAAASDRGTPSLTAGVVFNHGLETSWDEDSFFSRRPSPRCRVGGGRIGCESD